MNIEINSDIDWVPIVFLIAAVIIAVFVFWTIDKETQAKEHTRQIAIEQGWTQEQVKALK